MYTNKNSLISVISAIEVCVVESRGGWEARFVFLVCLFLLLIRLSMQHVVVIVRGDLYRGSEGLGMLDGL